METPLDHNPPTSPRSRFGNLSLILLGVSVTYLTLGLLGLFTGTVGQWLGFFNLIVTVFGIQYGRRCLKKGEQQRWKGTVGLVGHGLVALLYIFILIVAGLFMSGN